MAQSEIPEGLATDLDKILAGAVDAPTINTDKARAYAQRLGVTLSSAPHGHVFVNGKHFDLDDVSRSVCNHEWSSLTVASLVSRPS